ncbi:MAG: hypothetical protein JNK49_06950 [Planctomycetes bacterium]|nr:hypothetical protein [Planctomycetota bacterium]
MPIRPLPWLLLSAALASSTAATAQNGERRGPQRGAPAALAQFTHRTASFKSEAVGKDVPYAIYLPKDYDAEAQKDTKWPLVVWLHGMWEDHDRFHTRGGAPVLDQAVTDRLLPPCVFVLANGGRTSMYIDAGPGKNYQQLVQVDLLAHLAKTYRISDDRNQRALMGISMGGMAALRIGFTHPELFGTVAVHSSAVFPTNPKDLPPSLVQRASQFGLDEVFGNPIDETLWRATNPLGLAEALEPKTLQGLRLYFDAGTEDRYQFGRTNELLHQTLDKKKVPHTFELVQGGGHAWGSGFRESSLRQSLEFVGEAFALAAARGAALEGLLDGAGKEAKGAKDEKAGKGDSGKPEPGKSPGADGRSPGADGRSPGADGKGPGPTKG